MINAIEKEKCTGCKMCADICPKNAIEFKTDEQGFWYPTVTEDCVKCGLCLKKCPSLNEHSVNEIPPVVYSAWSKNDFTRVSSTSGGAFWEIAYRFLNNGGVVVGSRYADDWKSAKHIIARTTEELLAIKGSKYFQSDTNGIYREVKIELDGGRNVLFCGTPCQIAAIKVYLGKEYVNLFLMDFICRSISSPKAFRAYLDELESKYQSKVTEVHQKNKKNGWQSLATQVRFENGEESIKDKTEDWWDRGFIYSDLYTRESCYKCQYRVLPRINSDITIGDFWGIKGQNATEMFKGISVILINTAKGQNLFNTCKEEFDFKVHTIEEVLPGNPALVRNPIRTSKQDEFFSLLKSHPFSYCVSECTKEKVTSRLRKKILAFLRSCKQELLNILSADVDAKQYLYYNYFCKNVVRKSSAKIIPYKNAVIELQGNSQIVLSGTKNVNVGINKPKGSKTETHIRLNDSAVWNCTNGADLCYNTVLEIKQKAVFNSGFFTANGGSVIITHRNINFGEDVMIGRNVIIYDSDFHTLYNKDGIACNPPQTVNIEDHVWLTSNIIVQKGVTIGKDSLVAAFTTVNKDVPPHSMFGGASVGKVIKTQVAWSRQTCPLETRENSI